MNEKKKLIIKKNFSLAIENHKKKNYQIAANLYKKVLKVNPNHFESIYYLGILFGQKRRFNLAKPLLQKAIQIQPDNAVIHNNLGNMQGELGEYQIAISSYEKAITIQPNYLDAHYNYGVLLQKLGQHKKAISSYEKAIQIQPDYAIAYNNLGNVQRSLGQHKKAISSYEKAIQIQPDYAMAYNNLGILFQDLEQHKKAISSYEKAIQIQPDYAMAYNNLGNVQKEIKEYERAIGSYEKAIQIQPEYAMAHNNLGIIFQDLGENEKAINSYKMAAKYEPENLFYLYLLCRIDEKILNSNLEKKIYKIIEKNSCTKKNIAYGNFLLSRYELKTKKYKNEFDHLVKGHQLYFDSEEKKFKKNLKYWLNILPKKKLINFDRNNNITKDICKIKPIFIIGVPRCGSTLIEKIIASGSQNIPIGEETGIIDSEIENLINQGQLLNIDIKEIKKKILEKYKLKRLVKENNKYIFTDKSLENFFYLDLIKKIFPLAKIINCRRNPLSSIMSTLKNNLSLLSWPHNLENIFKYYNIYYQIIKDFEKTFPNFIYDLQYEKFVGNPEDESKKLMNFCDLPWDKKCLEFYKRKDLISETTSNFQIRKAVYKDSIDKYYLYKKFLSKYGNKYSWFN